MTSKARPLPASIFRSAKREPHEQEQNRTHGRAAVFRAVYGTISTIVTIAAVATLVAVFALPIVKISDDSAEPALANGSYVVLLRTDNPVTGDICGFSWNGRTLIRQVAAVGGDTVDITDGGRLAVNGEECSAVIIEESDAFPIQVPEGSFFVVGCGDEKTVEMFGDSYGCITDESLIGRAVCCVWPQPRLITRR